jgi:hypothetical protein
MGEILLMKTLKAFITYICYFGTGFVAMDKLLEGVLKDSLTISPAMQSIILGLLVAFWIVKIGWFIVDKYVNVKERYLEMDRTQEEIQDLKDNHKV